MNSTVIPFKTCTCCGQEYSKAEWNKLASLGNMDFVEEIDGRASTLVHITMKNCSCGGTMSVEVEAESALADLG